MLRMSFQEIQDEIENRAVKESMSGVNSGNWGMDRHVVKVHLVSKARLQIILQKLLHGCCSDCFSIIFK